MKYYNNFLQEDDDAYLARQNDLNIALSKYDHYDLDSKFSRCEPKSIGLKTNIFDYQINNLNFMLNREDNPLCDIFTNDQLVFFSNGLILNYNQSKFIKINDIPKIFVKGGVISDEPGIGKTLQMLMLCHLRPMKTMIIFPDHLGASRHWEHEIKKHFINPDKLLSYINLYTFSEAADLSQSEINKFKRIIIDEANEIYTINEDEDDKVTTKKNTLFSKMTSTKCKYKWLVTGTPFTSGADATYKIMLLLTDNNEFKTPKFTYPSFIRNKIYDLALTSLFRRNIKENIVTEINLPHINTNNILLSFSDFEQEIYDSEMAANENSDIDVLRKICSNIIIACSDEVSSHISIMQVKNNFLNKFKTMYESQLAILKSYEKNLENLVQTKKDFIENVFSYIEKYISSLNACELDNNIRHYQELVCSQQKIVESRLAVYKRYDKIINDIEKISETDENNDENSTCPICLCKLSTLIALYECGHVFCKKCSDLWREKNNKKCVICRAETHNDKIINITRFAKQNGTKIDYIIKLLRSTDEQFAIFTQFGPSITVMQKLLNQAGISCSIYNNIDDILDFKKNNKKALILSSASQISGIDLSFISQTIIMEPINGTYSFQRDGEKQLCARLCRIGQTKNVNMYRLIIKDTIEEQLQKN